MSRILTVARREFLSTVMTKGFLFAVLFIPVMGIVVSFLGILLVSLRPPPVKGSVAIIDRSVAPGGQPQAALAAVQAKLTPEVIAQRIRRDTSDEMKLATDQAKKLGPDAARKVEEAANAARSVPAPDMPSISVVPLPPDADIEKEKQALWTGTPYDGGRVALIVIDPDALVRKAPDQPFGRFQMFVKAKLDSRMQGIIKNQVRDGLVDARLAAHGQRPGVIRDLMRLDPPDPQAATPAGEKSAGELQQILVPMGFMILLWISSFTAGQYLLTSTIEEKSSRVMEVLLSAVSPMQLMTGKIIGQLGAGFLILLLYSGLGGAALIAFGLTYLVTPLTFVLLLVFFFIAFFCIASLMAAVGSAVTDVHEAQTLMMPVMLVMLTPMLLMTPISMNPNSPLATTLSFIPPLNAFVMILRLSSSDPPPAWQVAVSILIGVVAVYFFLRGAAKIFRIGVLMYGKPPNFATLVKWLRMA